jgi:hypothetical protein
MAAVAHQLGGIPRIVAVCAAIFFAVRDSAIAGWVRTFVFVSHIVPLLQTHAAHVSMPSECLLRDHAAASDT